MCRCDGCSGRSCAAWVGRRDFRPRPGDGGGGTLSPRRGVPPVRRPTRSCRSWPRGTDVIALALHVDYWDYIGWKPTACPARAYRTRQKGYARAVGKRMIYTPQFVIGGVDRVTGYEPMQLAELVQKASRRAAAHRTDRTGARARDPDRGAGGRAGGRASVGRCRSRATCRCTGSTSRAARTRAGPSSITTPSTSGSRSAAGRAGHLQRDRAGGRGQRRSR
jgi:hypothetical protein